MSYNINVSPTIRLKKKCWFHFSKNEQKLFFKYFEFFGNLTSYINGTSVQRFDSQ